MTARFTFLLFVAACECGAPEAEPEAPVPIAPSEEAIAVPMEEAAPTPPPCLQLGFTESFTASDAQTAENRRALRLHASGDHAASEQAFGALVDAAPGYDAARFNHACALALLGRPADALVELQTLMCRDLPTNAERAAKDEDLSALRPDIETLSAAVAAQVSQQLEGPVLMAGGGTFDWLDPGTGPARWVQSGVWRHDARRFVPVGPRVTAPLPMTYVTADRTRVMTFVGTLDDGEGSSQPPFRVALSEAVTGRALFDQLVPFDDDRFFANAFVDGDTVRLWWTDEEERPVRRVADATGLRSANYDLPEPEVGFGQLSAFERQSVPGFEVTRRGVLATSAGDIEIGEGHRPVGMGHRVEVDEGRGLAVVLSSRGDDCGFPDSYVFSVVDLRARALLWSRASTGNAAFRLHEGTLFLQTWDEQRERKGTLRFEDARAETAQELPAGFGVDMGPLGFNPYC